MCKRPIPAGVPYCKDCQVIADQRRADRQAKAAKRYNSKRDPRVAEFYRSPEWRLLRSVKLAQEGYRCEECRAHGVMRVAEDVHHIVQISEDWDRRLDITNLRCLCVDHHNAAHHRFEARGTVKKF